MISLVYGIFICVAGVVGIGWVLWIIRHGDTDRYDEDAARVFFDEHGHWPDETADDAAARRAATAAQVSAPVVTQAASDGTV
jgi:hypothetical protein